MIFDSRTSHSLLCHSINRIRFTLSTSACHFVTCSSPSSTLFTHTCSLSCISTPPNRNPRRPLRPIPQTHQSVGHSTKDDKGPEGIKRGNRDSRKQVKEREKVGKKNPFFPPRRPSPNPLGPRELLSDKETDGKKTN